MAVTTSPYQIRVETALGRVDVHFPDTEWDEPVETSLEASNGVSGGALRQFIRSYGVGVSGVRFSLDLCRPVDLVRTLEINDSYHHAPMVQSWGVISGHVPSDEEDQVTESAPDDHKYACLMAELSAVDGQKIITAAAQAIDQDFFVLREDTGEPWIERRPHITVKYGIVADDALAVQEAIGGFGPIMAVIGTMGCFENDGHDVLFFRVVSQDLERLNALVCDRLECVNTQPSYIPHATIGYLKPGLGQQFVGQSVPVCNTVIFDTLVFSDSEGNRYPVTLGDEPILEAASEWDYCREIP